MGAEQAKQLDKVSFPGVVEPTSPYDRQTTKTPALSVPESEMIGIAELHIKEPVLGEVQLNSLTGRDNKRKLKGTKDSIKQADLDDWVDDVIHIDAVKPVGGSTPT